MKSNINDFGRKCPACGKILHVGTKKENGEEESVEYCKSCGFRDEKL